MKDAKKTTMTDKQGRVLALDVGARRIGMAISDSLRITAQALPTFVRSEGLQRDLEELSSIVSQWEVELLVVGLPLNMNGTQGEQAAKIKGFAEKLSEFVHLPCVFVDERLTTAAADSLMRTDGCTRKQRSKHADQIAAQLILQSYLGN